MIAKFFLRKTSSGKSKSANHVKKSHSLPSGKEDGAEPLPEEDLDDKNPSSKFYVEVGGNLQENPSKDTDSMRLDLNPVASETYCSNAGIVSCTDSGIAGLSDNISGNPELRSMLGPVVLSGMTSSDASESSSPPVKIRLCRRESLYPPPLPPSPQQVFINIENQGGDQKDALEPSWKVTQAVEMRNGTNRTRGSVMQAQGLTVPTMNPGCRGSRRSFTTDDADIGLYKKPSFSPEFSPIPDAFKPKPVVLRRTLKGSDIGSKVEMFERMTCTGSRSFSKEDPMLYQMKHNVENKEAKPRPPVKLRASNWNSDSKPVSALKPLPPLKENVAPATAEKPPASAGVASPPKEKPQIPPNKPVISSTPDDPQGSILENNDNDLDEGKMDDSERNSFSDDDDDLWSEDENDSGDENSKQSSAENCPHEDGKYLAPIDKARKVAEELLKTEEAYVGRLKLLDQVFHREIINQNREEHFIPEDVIPQMFSSIKSILLFHNDFLLPQLVTCMAEWGSCIPRIGNVLKKFAPFLKLYTDYVKNFENATNLISSWTHRSSGFAACLDELQRLPECGNLTLQHHLLEPIQRVPRYELLLRDYIKHLPEDSADRVHATEALVLVTCAAQHSNMEMRKIEKFRNLLDINDALGGALDLVNPTRELVKEGKITKISARDGDHRDRYLFLFNDLLVVCQSLPLKQLGLRLQQYVVKSQLDIRGMQVLEGNNLETAHTFVIKSKQQSIEFCGGTQELKEEWQKALWCAISDYTKKEHSRFAVPNILAEFEEKELGKRAPTWVRDQETTMCMVCGERFGTFKRRHHCRCCGKVVCNKCSAYKAKLAYNESAELRVCVNCFAALGLQQAKVSAEKGALNKARAVLKTGAADPSVLSGYLNMSSNKKNWNRKFFAIHSNFVLYSFKAHQDVIAHTSLPLPGYKVSSVEKGEDIQMKDFVFCISKEELSKFYYFQADDESQRKRWIEVLRCAIVAELPSSIMFSPSTPKVEIRSNEASPMPSSDASPSTIATCEPMCDSTVEQEEQKPLE